MKKKYVSDIEEFQERRGDAWVKGIILFFFTLMFIFYINDMFDQVLLDGITKAKVETEGDTTRYRLRSGTIEVVGIKNKDPQAIITQSGTDRITASYRVSFSEPTDWEHSLITLYNMDDRELFSKQYNGYEAKKYKENKISYNELYDQLIAITLGKGTRMRGEMVYFILAVCLVIVEILTFKLWKWFFLKKQINWAVDRGTIPSPEYKWFINICRFLLFLIILYFILKSYGLSTASIFQGNPYSWLD